jgi:hypothetical protein
LYTFFSAVGKVTEVQQVKPGSPGEHQQFMISFQQAETARCVLTSMDGLSLGGCKMYVKISTVSRSPALHMNLRNISACEFSESYSRLYQVTATLYRDRSRPTGAHSRAESHVMKTKRIRILFREQDLREGSEVTLIST